MFRLYLCMPVTCHSNHLPPSLPPSELYMLQSFPYVCQYASSVILSPISLFLPPLLFLSLSVSRSKIRTPSLSLDSPVAFIKYGWTCCYFPVSNFKDSKCYPLYRVVAINSSYPYITAFPIHNDVTIT